MPSGLICVIKDYRYKPIFFFNCSESRDSPTAVYKYYEHKFINDEWQCITNPSPYKYIIPKAYKQSESSYKFIEQIYNSVNIDCFKKILEFVKINNETELSKMKYNTCVREFKNVLYRSLSTYYKDTHIDDFYCITTLKLDVQRKKRNLEYHERGFPFNNNLYNIFRFNELYCDLFRLGVNYVDDDHHIYEIVYDTDYYEGLDFLLTKCDIIFTLRRDEDRIYVSYKLKEPFKNIKYKKTYETYGYTNQQEFLENSKYCGFIFDDEVSNGSIGDIRELGDDNELNFDQVEEIIKYKDCLRWINDLL